MPRDFIRHLKEEYPKGTRIELELMNDPFAPVEPGTRGTVVNVDDAGQIHMQWDNGRTLALVPTEDDFRKLTLEEIMQEQNNISDNSINEAESTEDSDIWENLLPIGEEKAVACFLSKNINVYKVYDDNTESLVESLEEIDEHSAKGGMFGVEQEETPIENEEIKMEKAYKVKFWELSEKEFENGTSPFEDINKTEEIFGEGYTITDYYDDNSCGRIRLENEDDHFWFYSNTNDEKRYVVIKEINELSPDEAYEFNSKLDKEPPIVKENLYVVKQINQNGERKLIAASFDKHEAIQYMNEAWERLSEAEKENSSLQTGYKTVHIPQNRSPKQEVLFLDSQSTNKEWLDATQPLAEASSNHTDSNRMLIVPPGDNPYDAYVYDSLEALQGMVDGYIECTYPFNDNAFVIGNEEARLNGMQGNRRINGEIYAGTILVAADDGCGGTKDLTEEQVREYAGKLWQPEDISPAEVADVHYSYQTFNSDKEFFAALGFDM